MLAKKEVLGRTLAVGFDVMSLLAVGNHIIGNVGSGNVACRIGGHKHSCAVALGFIVNGIFHADKFLVLAENNFKACLGNDLSSVRFSAFCHNRQAEAGHS